MTKEGVPTLQLTYEQFAEVLRRLDAYTRVEFSKMARGFPVLIGEDYDIFGDPRPPSYASTVAVNISDLAELIWRFLEARPDEVDRIHDEVFVESQVEHFKKTYSSPEHVASQIRGEYGERNELASPTELFFKLGKPARRILMEEGFLEEAIKAFEQGEEIVRGKEQGEKIENSRRRRQEKQMIETRRRVRELDSLQCVFCGTQVSNNFRYVQLAAGEYLPENVVLSCSPCNTRLKHKVPEAAEMAPTFGRFTDPNFDMGEATRVM
jgi:transcription elongation factor Elf1